MFTAVAIVTFLAALFLGRECWKALIEDLEDKRQKKRGQNIATSCLFIFASTCAVVTAVHDLTQIWTQ